MNYFIDDSQRLETQLSIHAEKTGKQTKNEVYLSIVEELLSLAILETEQVHHMLKSEVKGNKQIISKVINLLTASTIDGDIEDNYVEFVQKWLLIPLSKKRTRVREVKAFAVE